MLAATGPPRPAWPGDAMATTMEDRPRPPDAARFQIRLSRGLLLGFGGLVLLAVLTVLAVGLWSARQNTFDLLRDKSEAALALLLARIERYLEPAEHMLRHLGRRIEAGEVDETDDAEIARSLSGALAATPQIHGLVLIRADARLVYAARHRDGVALHFVDAHQRPTSLAMLDSSRAAAGFHWGRVRHIADEGVTLVNARYPLRREGRYLGVLAAGVRVDTLSTLLEDAARTLGGSAFVLYGRDLVLAHPRLIGGKVALDPDSPLPSVARLGDPVVAAARREALAPDPGSPPAARTGIRISSVWRRARGWDSPLAARTGIRIVEAGGARVALLSRFLDRYGDEPWLVTVRVPAAALTQELRRLLWAAGAGVVVLLLALAAAWALARTLSAPFIRLAEAAEQVRGLALDRVRPLPESLFKEVASAFRAFDAMVVGLRWFETYVPRDLVRRLVARGAGAAEESVGREATVMFTDIVGFTRQSEEMTAPETARFLNGHFAVLAGCVEAEGGTIDKFIGDSLMAFWGAPEPAPDHAARACRAALAIRAALAADNARRRAAGAAAVRVRIGLHSGPVIVGNIGAPGRINYTVVGDTVNTANRIEGLAGKAAPDEPDAAIALSAATARAAAGAAAPVAAGTRPIRGRAGEVALYRL